MEEALQAPRLSTSVPKHVCPSGNHGPPCHALNGTVGNLERWAEKKTRTKECQSTQFTGGGN